MKCTCKWEPSSSGLTYTLDPECPYVGAVMARLESTLNGDPQ